MGGCCRGAETILIPEEKSDYESIIKRLKRTAERGKRHSIIIVAEGAMTATELAIKLEEADGIETRLCFRTYSARGSPSARDRVIASQYGARAVEVLIEGRLSADWHAKSSSGRL